MGGEGRQTMGDGKKSGGKGEGSGGWGPPVHTTSKSLAS